MEASRVTKIILSSLLQSYYVKPFSFFTIYAPRHSPSANYQGPHCHTSTQEGGGGFGATAEFHDGGQGTLTRTYVRKSKHSCA